MVSVIFCLFIAISKFQLPNRFVLINRFLISTSDWPFIASIQDFHDYVNLLDDSIFF